MYIKKLYRALLFSCSLATPLLIVPPTAEADTFYYEKEYLFQVKDICTAAYQSAQITFRTCVLRYDSIGHFAVYVHFHLTSDPSISGYDHTTCAELLAQRDDVACIQEYRYYWWTSCPNGMSADVSGLCSYGPVNSPKNQGSGDCQSPEIEQGNPINIGTGNKYQVEIDYVGANAFPLTVSRTYNSDSGGWQHLPELQPNVGLTEVVAVHADGKQQTFTKDPSGNWLADADVTGSLISLLDGGGAINGWQYTDLGGRVAEYDLAGKITSFTSRSGIAHTYTHGASTISVAHSLGGTLTYQLDVNGRITGFTAPDSNQYSYGYDTSDRLASITYPNSGGTRTYHYENGSFANALTGITDEKGTRFATWAYDAQGRAISSEHHNSSEKVTLDYTHIDDSTDPRVTATNALGKQTTYHMATIHGVRKVIRVEGHQSANCAAANKAYTYDANGFLASSTDWLGRLTNYTRNSKGQELTRTEAVGTAEEQGFTTQWHATLNLPTKITALGYEIVYSYDANGNLLSRQLNDLTAP